MGGFDADNMKSEADILARQSRPQHNSTFIPKTRDWRYATGVLQHDDFDDAPKSRSVWDNLDYDYQASDSDHNPVPGLNRSETELNGDEAPEVGLTPKSTTSTASHIGAVYLKTVQDLSNVPMSAWAQVTRFKLSDEGVGDDGSDKYIATALIVRLRFTGHNKAKAKTILEESTQMPTPPNTVENYNQTPDMSPLATPATSRTAVALRMPHQLDSINSVRKFPLFKREWVDETYDFNVGQVRSKLRPVDKEVDELGSTYNWYTNAVPVDAIFPPGVPLSAKEINAFYPHHVRWRDVMVRLTKNDYRGADILGMQAYFRGAPSFKTTVGHMNGYQRDAVKISLPGFKTTTYKGKSDRNLRTDRLKPGQLIHVRKGYTLPTFDDLVRGLQRLPSGLDARGLTQCLSWYLHYRDTFTPKLELNVLHAQPLIRALREPLRPFGPQNLDRNALEEWRSKGTFETQELEDKNQGNQEAAAAEAGPSGRSQLHINVDTEDVTLHHKLPLRHLFTFSFLSMQSMVGEALKLGIKKAEARKEARLKAEKEKIELKAKKKEELERKNKKNAGEVTQEQNESVSPTGEASKLPSKPPKRPLPVDAGLLSSHKKPRVATSSRTSLPVSSHKKARVDTSSRTPRPPPRKLAPAPPRPAASPYTQGASPNYRDWNASTPWSAYAPQSQMEDDVYSRREHHPQMEDNAYGYREYQPRQPEGILQNKTYMLHTNGLPGQYAKRETQTSIGTGIHPHGQTLVGTDLSSYGQTFLAEQQKPGFRLPRQGLSHPGHSFLQREQAPMEFGFQQQGPSSLPKFSFGLSDFSHVAFNPQGLPALPNVERSISTFPTLPNVGFDPQALGGSAFNSDFQGQTGLMDASLYDPDNTLMGSSSYKQDPTFTEDGSCQQDNVPRR